jgi:hypothetical protein
MPRRDIQDILAALAAAEQREVGKLVFTPVLRGVKIRTRIAGIVCELRVRNAAPEGWGVLRTTSTSTAVYERPATLAERDRCLQPLPRVRLLLLARQRRGWLAVPAYPGSGQIHVDGPVPVMLVDDDVSPFEEIVARYDGQTFWFDQLASPGNPERAAALRAALDDLVEPGEIHIPGMTPAERDAYARTWNALGERRQQRVEERLRRRLSEELAHGGATLLNYAQQGEVVQVRYELGGQAYTQTFHGQSLRMIDSGVCLSGQDGNFDLASSVSVMRERAQGLDGRRFGASTWNDYDDED